MSPEQSLLRLFPRQRWCETRLLLAVSGGADSVALLRAVCHVSDSVDRIEAAHVNHGWRGIESDNDEHFVQELCQQHGVKLHVHRCTPPHVRSEESAREVRYRFLSDTAYRCGARYVLTAHTASDRVETLLHNLFRGTGLAGVSTPTVTRPLEDELVLVRPMLDCTREDVEAYLASLNQPFRCDSSNADQTYRRNFLRHSLLPMLREQYGPQVDQRLLAFSQLAEETLQVHRTLAEDYLDRADAMWKGAASCEFVDCSDSASAPLVIPRERQLPMAWPIVFQALQLGWQRCGWSLQAMSRDHWTMLRQAWSCSAQPDQSLIKLNQLPGNLHVHQLSDWLLVFGDADQANARNVEGALPTAQKKTRSPGHENNKDDNCSQRAPR